VVLNSSEQFIFSKGFISPLTTTTTTISTTTTTRTTTTSTTTTTTTTTIFLSATADNSQNYVLEYESDEVRCGRPTDSGYIVGGKEAKRGAFPFAALLGYKIGKLRIKMLPN